MTDLKDIRKDIDAIDETLIALFMERMEKSRLVAEYKKEKGMPIFSPEREEEILAWAYGEADEGMGEYAQEFFKSLMDISKKYQSELLGL